jgi:hypothetical protein
MRAALLYRQRARGDLTRGEGSWTMGWAPGSERDEAMDWKDRIVIDFPVRTRDEIRACLAFAAARERRLASSAA